MIGYGFGDINIHDVYFKFLEHLENNERGNAEKKFYIVLTKYDREYYGIDEQNNGATIQKESKYYELYKRFLKSKRIEVIEADDLETFLLKLHEEYMRSLRMTKERAQTLLDQNKEVIHDIFAFNDFEKELDVNTIKLLVQRSVVFDEWIEEKAELRDLKILKNKNKYFKTLQRYLCAQLIDSNKEKHLYLIGLSA